MSLSKTQQEFTVKIAELINFATAIGCQLTFGDAYRDPRVHGDFGDKESYSAANSIHKKRLAVDFNLFVNGDYVSNSDHEMYIMLGEQWEKMHPLARWGGRFNDANHFSFEYAGYK